MIAAHHHTAFPVARVAAERDATVSVCLPARDEAVLRGEVVVFLDADSEDLGAHVAAALAGAVALPGGAALAKGFYRRPFRIGQTVLPSGGGRVTELTARPLLNLLFPELAGVQQPLAGELGARRDLLERLPVLCGYAVDVALLIDAFREVGAAGLAQVDLDVRSNRHQPLEDLAPMAFAVAAAVVARVHAEGRVAEPPPARFLGPGRTGSRSGACSSWSARRCAWCATGSRRPPPPPQGRVRRPSQPPKRERSAITLST